MKVSTIAQMRAMDRMAIERYGIAENLLMENAGLAAFQVLAQQVDVPASRAVVMCGSGNNGGDGLVVARQLCSAGGDVTVVLMSDPGRFTGAAALNYEIVAKLGVEIVAASELDTVSDRLRNADVIVDAMLGTGIERAVTGKYADMVSAINASDALVLSVDTPSGINGDTGQVMGIAVKADWTVTFGLPKFGNVLSSGWEWGGELFISHISFPPAIYDADELKIDINTPISLPLRDPGGHKGTFGQALFVAGAANYYGAPYLSAMSFLKAGGGYARLAAPAAIVPTMASMGCEIVFVPQQQTPNGGLAMSNLSSLLELAARQDFVVIGPGLSLHGETQELVRRLVTAIEKPLLIDGDGISAIQHDLDCVRNRNARTVITPHLGELSRLCGASIPEIKADGLKVLRQVCEDLDCCVVMKGAHSLIGQADGRVCVNMSGNSGMGSAGSGDVLSGTIPAMFGLGLAFEDAVQMGVFAHGLAGDLAADQLGEDGMTATDVLAHLPQAMRLLREGVHAPALNRYRIPVVP